MKDPLLLFCLAVCFLSVVGCGGDFEIVPVGGTVTMDGKPLEGVEVVFAPAETDQSSTVGPVSIGVTDSQGRYQLKTIQGQNGAVKTEHRVSVTFTATDEGAIGAKLDELVAADRSMPEEQFLRLERKIREEMTNRKQVVIPKQYNRETTLRFNVEGPTTNADFDLKSSK